MLGGEHMPTIPTRPGTFALSKVRDWRCGYVKSTDVSLGPTGGSSKRMVDWRW
jgi:hypothetical protein